MNAELVRRHLLTNIFGVTSRAQRRASAAMRRIHQRASGERTQVLDHFTGVSRRRSLNSLLALPVEEAYGFEWDFPTRTPSIGGRRIGVVELTPADAFEL